MTHSTLVEPLLEIISSHHECCVVFHRQRQQKALHALLPFKKNQVIVSFCAAEQLSAPTYLTIQTDHQTHITLSPSFLQFTNHSCRPNVFFDTTHMQLVALQDIAPNEELCFFYPSTEWDMAEAFQCACGQPTCLKEIKGARYLTEKQLEQYQLTNFIQQQRADRKQ